MAATTIVTTNFLVSNLHCPSCVSAIEASLNVLSPPPTSISSSIVSSWVTVRHHSTLDISTIFDALQKEGYEVVSISSDDPDVAGQVDLEEYGSAKVNAQSKKSKLWRGRSRSGLMTKEDMWEKHLEKCEACRNGEPGVHGREGAETSVMDAKAAEDKDSRSMAKISSSHNLSLVVVDSGNDDLLKASYSIGGMTCQSCVGTVMDGVKSSGFSWVKKISVDLVSASGIIEFSGKEHLNLLTEALEDTGMEILLQSVVDITPRHISRQTSRRFTERQVAIRVDGMFCDNCPELVHQALETFGGAVNIEKPLRFSDSVPIIRIRYVPSQPNLTIRKIFEVISGVNSDFKVSIYNPPTLEQLSANVHRAERIRLLLRVSLSIIVAIPTLIIGVIYMSLVPSSNPSRKYLGRPWAMVTRSQWALFVLATPVYFYSAGLFHERAIKELYNIWRPGSKMSVLRRLYRFGSMNMLMSLGTSIAYISSVAQLIAAPVQHRSIGDNAFYFDTVVFLTMFVLIGRLVEAYSKERTGDAISLLGNLRPSEAVLLETDNSGAYSTRTVSVDLLEFEDLVQVPPGGSPPSDGIIAKGDSSFDESSLTGESKLVKKLVGDQVFAGTINKSAPITISITGLAGNSMLDQIVNAVRDGQTQHAPIEKLADSLTAYFVPVIVALAVLTWITWLSLGLSGALSRDFIDVESESWAVWSLGMAVAVFVVACPCGIGLAAPTALVVGSGLAAQNGILAKGGGEAFEKASKIDCIVFDKTGTLTMGGEPKVTDHYETPWSAEVFQNSDTSNELYNIVTTVEESSSHPLAKAIISFCKTEQGSVSIGLDSIEEIPGHGMKAAFSFSGSEVESTVLIGNEALMTNNYVILSTDEEGLLLKWKRDGKSVVLVSMKGSESQKSKLIAMFGISDPIRPECAGLVKDLQAKSIDVWLLSGDNPTTATAIGAKAGIPSSNIIAGVLPTEKANHIKSLQSSLKSRNGNRALIAMVGDGINDAPALTAADVGIAIGSGSDIAISAADFVLISPDLRTVLALLDLSRIVFRRIKFNFGWALIYNMIGVPIAAGCLMGVKSHGERVRLQPVWASLAMALSSVSVVASSLALRSGIPGVGFRRERNI